jgi:hypothetical protein
LQAAADLDASTKLPADTAAQQQVAQLVLGSLDVNQGAVLPAEDLVGRLPTVRHVWCSWQRTMAETMFHVHVVGSIWVCVFVGLQSWLFDSWSKSGVPSALILLPAASLAGMGGEE